VFKNNNILVFKALVVEIVLEENALLAHVVKKRIWLIFNKFVLVINGTKLAVNVL